MQPKNGEDNAHCPCLSSRLTSSAMRRLVFSFLVLAVSLSGYAQTLLVANQGDRSVSVVDIASQKQVGVIQETIPDEWGHEIAASPDGRVAYLPIYGNSGVGRPGLDGSKMLVIDVPTRKITGTVDFGRGVRPHCVVYERNSNLLYVTAELARIITIVDPKSLKVVGTIPTGAPESHMLAISSDGKRGYTSNVGSGSVSVLDLVSRRTLAVIPVARKAQRISISDDNKFVFTSDQTKPRLAVIDTATNKIKTWITLPALGYGTASTSDGKWLLVALPSSDKVAVVDLSNMKISRTIDVCRSPQEILAHPNGIAYVSCVKSNQIAAFDVKQGKVQSLIDVGKGADGLAWAESK
jgi:DNA-binding beta-propeller fold protein YncE